MRRRRMVRDFSSDPVPFEVIRDAIEVAGTAPSGAHQQPWTYMVIANPELKRQLRAAAEEEERRSYDGRMSDAWIAAAANSAPTGTRPTSRTRRTSSSSSNRSTGSPQTAPRSSTTTSANRWASQSDSYWQPFTTPGLRLSLTRPPRWAS